MSSVVYYQRLLLAEADAADAYAETVLETAKLAKSQFGIAEHVMKARDTAERLRQYAAVALEENWPALLSDTRLAAFVQVLRDDPALGETLRQQFAEAVLVERTRRGP